MPILQHKFQYSTHLPNNMYYIYKINAFNTAEPYYRALKNITCNKTTLCFEP